MINSYLSLAKSFGVMDKIDINDLKDIISMHQRTTGKIIALIRVSTQQQDLEQQRQAVLLECNKMGYYDDNVILIEDKESAIKLSEEERNGLTSLKWHINNDPTINCVITYEMSRISRISGVVYSIRDFLINKKIQLIVMNPYFKMLKDDGTLSETSNIFFGIFAAMAENEMLIKKARFARGRAKSKSEGRIYCGKPLFGYILNKKTGHAEPKYEEAEIIRDIYYKYANDIMTASEIATYYHEQGTFGNDKIYTVKRRITHILQLPEYKGTKIQYPAIVTEEIWDKAQIRRKKNIWHIDERVRGKVKISQKMFYDYDTGMMFTPHGRNYTANMKLINGKCNNIAKETADWCIIEITKHYIDDYINDTHSKLLKQEEHLDKVTNNFIDKIADEKEKLERLDDLYIDGKLTKSVYESKYIKIETIIQQLEHQMHETLLQRTANLNMRINNQNEDIEKMTPEQQKEIIRNIINKILIQRVAFYKLILHVELKTGITEKWEISTNNMKRSLNKI